MAVVKDRYFRCQNVSNEVLLVWFKFQAKPPSRSGKCVQREWKIHTPSSSPLSKNEGLGDIGHSMSIGNLILGVNSVTVSFIITVYYKMRQILSQYATAILLQNATEVYYKIRQIFLLQNATVITNCDNFITKCSSYYNMPRLLQIATVHTISNKKTSFELETLLIAFILGWFH